MASRLATVAALVALCCGGGGGAAGGMRGPHHPRGDHIHQNHHHHQPSEGTKITADTELLRDVHHIKEDLGEWGLSGEALRALTPEELDFHYFKLHDFDNNTKLDGLEILQAIHHTVHNEEAEGGAGAGAGGEGGGGERRRRQEVDDDDLEYFIGLIDQVLAEDDRDGDGFLSYMEYVVARQREQTKADGEQRPTKGGQGPVHSAIHTHN